jgi:NADH-quinone oxidoreductase subunit M
VLLIAVASILYGSAMAFTTTQMRLVLGYSSVAQLGFIVLGVFALNETGSQGAVLQMVNHGLVVAPAFFVLALLAERVGSEDLRDMGGLALRAPVLATMALIVTFAVLAIPGSSNFIGEFMILLGTFESKIVYAFVASAGMVLASVYALRLFIRQFHNNRGVERVESRELSFRDGLVLVPLVAAIVAFALYPQLALHRSERSVTQSVAAAKSLAGGGEAAAVGREATP